MIGLVLVCHSARLAEGVAELAAQMGGEGLRIGVAGGLDQPGSRWAPTPCGSRGPSRRSWSEDGVLVLMDLGSAVLSAEMALDLLPEERRGRVLLTEAPLVEGAVAAAVAAGARAARWRQAAEEARGGAGRPRPLTWRRRPPAAAPAPPAAGAGPPRRADRRAASAGPAARRAEPPGTARAAGRAARADRGAGSTPT